MSDRSALSAGDSQGYIDALLEFLGDREPLEVFGSTEAALREAVKEIDDKTLRTSEAPGKWSIIEVVKHLADAEIMLGYRYRKVLGEDAPDIPAIDQDAWVKNMNQKDAELAETLDDFAAVRNVNLRLLRLITPEQSKRYGMHNQRGKETVMDMMKLYAAHDLYHLYQIERIRTAVER
jgi:uncharacterized damage-inducible protein DinB